jgi:hypothetical protein
MTLGNITSSRGLFEDMSMADLIKHWGERVTVLLARLVSNSESFRAGLCDNDFGDILVLTVWGWVVSKEFLIAQFTITVLPMEVASKKMTFVSWQGCLLPGKPRH